MYLILGSEVSGAERMHAELIRRDPDALVVCPLGGSSERFARDLGARLEPLSFRVLRHSGGLIEMGRSVGRGLRTAWELRRILRRHPDRDLVFCTGIRPGMVAALAVLGLRRRLLWCVPDFLPPSPLRQIVRIMVRRTAESVLCLSQAIIEDLCAGSQALRELAVLVHPGVALERFDHARTSHEEPVAAVLGHVSHVKRTDLAVEIAARVRASEPAFELRIVGRAQFRAEDFELERELRARVQADPRLSGGVTFAGFASDVGEALSPCRMLLHTRPDEPFGIALVEAMAMGLPVVAPAAAGPLEIVIHEETGFLYPPGDVEAAASAVLALTRDRGLARRMGSAARERVEREFNVERQLQATRALLSRSEPGAARA